MCCGWQIIRILDLRAYFMTFWLQNLFFITECYSNSIAPKVEDVYFMCFWIIES